MDENEQVVQEGNEEQVQIMDADVQQLPAGTVSLRAGFGRRRGEFVANLVNAPQVRVVRPDWRVFAAAGEGIVDGDLTAGKLMGAAKFTVNNVVPENGSVKVWVTIAWEQPIVLFIDYLLIPPF
jgi:hypothetical protein